jgi:hypothetical protein
MVGVKKRRWLWRLTAYATVIVGMALTAITAYAVQSDGGFLGSTAPGSHQWIQDLEGAQYCGLCHSGVAADLAAGPHSSEFLSSCVICHPPQFDDGLGHAARSAYCSDCHGYSSPGEPHAGPNLNCDTCHAVHGPLFGGAVHQLKSDAHAGIREDLGEFDDTQVSKTCLACHTHIDVNLEAVPKGPLELRMGD